MPDQLFFNEFLLKNPVRISITPKSSTVDAIELMVIRREKEIVFTGFDFAKSEVSVVLVFSRTSHNADRS